MGRHGRENEDGVSKAMNGEDGGLTDTQEDGARGLRASRCACHGAQIQSQKGRTRCMHVKDPGISMHTMKRHVFTRKHALLCVHRELT